MVLVDPCLSANINVDYIDDQFIDMVYTLRDPYQYQIWSIESSTENYDHYEDIHPDTDYYE